MPAVALHAARTLVPSSWARIGTGRPSAAVGLVRARGWRRRCHGRTVPGARAHRLRPDRSRAPPRHQAGRCAARARRRVRPLPLSPRRTAALAWVAFKVGALSYGGGFVIIPLMQHDAVHAYHWMTDAQFLNAVALGQVTPGPVVLTVATVGYAAAGVGGGLLAAADRVRSFLPLRSDRRASLLSAPCQPVGAGVPRRCRARGDRRHRGVDDPARPCPRPLVAGPNPGGRARRPAAVATRGVVVTILGTAIVGLVVALAGAPV